MSVPRVALVGAGPGDIDLMTLRAEAVLAAAATVVSDAAVQGLARGFAPQAELVLVADGAPAVPALLAAASVPDRDVVRLYAGDPWLSPAHDEELSALNRAGIATEAIPGVAIEVAVPALAGIAVHVRHLAVACTLGSIEAVPAAADPARTLVISCDDDGAAAARRLAARGGQDLPAAILPIGGGPGEVRGVLGDLGRGAGRPVPSLLVVGAVADPGPSARGVDRDRRAADDSDCWGVEVGDAAPAGGHGGAGDRRGVDGEGVLRGGRRRWAGGDAEDAVSERMRGRRG